MVLQRVLLILLGLVLARPVSAQDLRVFFGNLHSHTSYSDGSGTPSEAFRYAKDRGRLDFLAITEHNHRQADGSGDRRDGRTIARDHALYNGSGQSSLVSAARRYTEPGRFVALYGQEFSTISSGNHVNVFHVDAVIEEDEVPSGDYLSLLDSWLIQHPDSRRKRALLQLNHPEGSDKPNEYGRDDFPNDAQWREKLGKHARLIEVFNGPALTAGENKTAKSFARQYLKYLNMGFTLAPSGDQDNHYKTWGTITDARTAVIADELTTEKILGAIEDRHVYATEDKNLRLVFRINGHLMGDVVPDLPAENSELSIEYSLVDDDEPDASYEITLYGDAPGGDLPSERRVVARQGNTETGVSERIEDVRFNTGDQYFLFSVVQLGDHDESEAAWTAPIWFDARPDGALATTALGANGPVASRNSVVYHVSLECRDAKNIADHNRLFGDDATRGRRLHSGCPRR